MNAFERLPEYLQEALKRLCITQPTPVQQAALPPALQGRDILATAQTGTGKTFAFLLPLIVRLEAAADKTALILSPTRELAQQTLAALESLLPDEKVLPRALIIGGDNIHKQYAVLRRRPRVVIGTPGRIIDHIGRKSLSLKNAGFFVLDEADRMLDMGFIPDVRKIGAAMPSPRQTLLFSATLPKEIEQLAGDFLQNPARVQIGSVTRPADLVLQQFMRLGTRERLGQLVFELEGQNGLTLVFVKSKHGADRLAKQLKLHGVKANALHGDLRQNRRRQVMELFRSGAVPVLVATDVAARGIDVDGVNRVINYDLPQCPEDYIHRIGRTGRAGSAGTALSFVTEDESKWKDICRVCRLGRVEERTKTSRILPPPKFTPEPPRKKERKELTRVGGDPCAEEKTSLRAAACANKATPATNSAVRAGGKSVLLVRLSASKPSVSASAASGKKRKNFSAPASASSGVNAALSSASGVKTLRVGKAPAAGGGAPAPRKKSAFSSRFKKGKKAFSKFFKRKKR